jgi:hypothetical protein
VSLNDGTGWYPISIVPMVVRYEVAHSA